MQGTGRFTFALQVAHVALTRVWLHAKVRFLCLAVVTCAALVAASPLAAASRSVDRGIVIRIRAPRVLVMRELDGTRMRYRITPTTIIRLDGRRVRLRRLQPGDVAVVVHDGDDVTAVRAFRP
jgi:hypothetical protein